MTWNYRLVRRKFDSGDVVYGVHEAYYNERDRLTSITQDPIDVTGATRAEVERTWTMMAEAFKKPAVDWKTRRELRS